MGAVVEVGCVLGDQNQILAPQTFEKRLLVRVADLRGIDVVVVHEPVGGFGRSPDSGGLSYRGGRSPGKVRSNGHKTLGAPLISQLGVSELGPSPGIGFKIERMLKRIGCDRHPDKLNMKPKISAPKLHKINELHINPDCEFVGNAQLLVPKKAWIALEMQVSAQRYPTRAIAPPDAAAFPCAGSVPHAGLRQCFVRTPTASAVYGAHPVNGEDFSVFRRNVWVAHSSEEGSQVGRWQLLSDNRPNDSPQNQQHPTPQP